MTFFGPEDVGCYADGTHGHAHVRVQLAELVEALDMEPSLVAELLAPMSDDASEEDDAIDLLNEHCEGGVYFTFRDGDLMLVQEEEEEGE